MTKKKVLVLSDHPLSPSGVGTQTKYMIEALLKTGRYQFVCLGGAMRHNDYTPQKVEPYGEDFRIFPVDGYGTHEIIRSVLQKERPDALWFMTDPRFYGWLWEIENEIRANIPMIYYHVWDNFPAPMFNKGYYQSNDKIVCISKVTHEIVKTVAPDIDSVYLPHAVDGDLFKPLAKSVRKRIRKEAMNIEEDKFVFFWNNRNARRKQSGTLIFWFKEFLDRVGHDKATLLMHTDPHDVHGQNLTHIMQHLGLNEGQLYFSTAKMPPEKLGEVYNSVDCTINISDAEGFGLGTLESLSCGTPIIVNMTGGLQEQVTDGSDWFGWGIKPAARSIIGSLQVPYIYEDRITQDDFEKTLDKALKCSKKQYQKMSKNGMEHVNKNYNFENYEKSWVKLIDQTIKKHGSWDTRKNYTRWELIDLQ